MDVKFIINLTELEKDVKTVVCDKIKLIKEINILIIEVVSISFCMRILLDTNHMGVQKIPALTWKEKLLPLLSISEPPISYKISLDIHFVLRIQWQREFNFSGVVADMELVNSFWRYGIQTELR